MAKKENLPLVVLGNGTNIVPRNCVEAVIALMKTKKIEIIGDMVEAEAGEDWDNLVKTCIEKNLSGLENLSWIPGTCGAAPVQNIGAYGTEICDCIFSVETYDRQDGKFKTLSKSECEFGYRTSIFKKFPDKFIIVSIKLKLQKTDDNLREIRKNIMAKRKKKIPDPKVIPNAGSYFINPVIDGQKIYAGKLIEETGLKGAKIGKIQISPDNALILTNPKRASFKEIKRAEKFIIQKVFKKFKIRLEREPVII